MNSLITIEKDAIRLTSNLDEYSFGKTNYNSILNQEGYIFDGGNLKIWSFDEVKSFKVEGKTENIVFYCGSNPLSKNAKTLAQYFEDGGDDLYIAVKTVCSALTMAAQHNTKLPVLGAGGILVDLSQNHPQALFIPQTLFTYSSNGLNSDDFEQLQGGWINESLQDIPAICFLRGTIVYHLLSGRLPYEKANPTERNADILDQRFLPVELCVNGIAPAFAKEINTSLKLTSNVVNIPGKKKKGKTTEELIANPDFDFDELEKAWELSKKQKNTSDKDFEEKVANYIKIRDSKISTKRKLRRNTSLIITGICIFFVVLISIINAVKSNLDDYTSKGLTSTQTIQAYFKGVNAKDTILLSELVKGKNPNGYVDTISRVYVVHKQRLAYGDQCGFASPAYWLFYCKTMEKYKDAGLYGITHLQIDGKPFETSIEMQKKKDNPAPLEKEGNITLSDKSESVHKVEYYFLHTGEEDVDFAVDKITETFNLTFIKDKWLITNIETETERLSVDCKKFIEDYLNQLEANENDVLKATSALRSKYFWLPTEQTMKAEYDRIMDEYLHPFKELGF